MKAHRVAAGVVLAMGLTACSNSQAGTPGGQFERRPPTPAKAQLNPKTGEIVYPLEKYSPSISELHQSSRIGEEFVAQCMKARGVSISLAPEKEASPSEDRAYGIWVRSLASKHGYGSPSDGQPDLILAQLKESDLAKYDSCGEDLTKFFWFPLSGFNFDSLSERLRGQAHFSAVEDPAWKKSVEEWKKCLRAQGHEISDDATAWSPNLPGAPDDEQAIRIALADIDCKEKTNLVQTLADLEASYQQTLVNENEAALKAQRDEIDKQVAAGKKWLAEHTQK